MRNKGMGQEVRRIEMNKVRTIVGVLLLVLVAGCSSRLAPEIERGKVLSTLSLESLRADCSISKRWFGAVNRMPWAAWLDCNGHSAIITHPLNLLGHVRIMSAAQARRYVRFFSSADTYYLFLLDGMAEIRRDEDAWPPNLLEALEEKKAFRRADAYEITEQGVCYDNQGEDFSCQKRSFAIRRIAVFYDQNVYEVHETIGQDGNYTLERKDLLLADTTQFGYWHQPP
ncbi:MAG: hypothetical protein AAF772_04755 [Acidobacteriota bacterium]